MAPSVFRGQRDLRRTIGFIPSMGRTLLSAAFDFSLTTIPLPLPIVTANLKIKNNPNTGGQEWPPTLRNRTFLSQHASVGKISRQCLPGIRLPVARHLLRRSLGNNPSTFFSTLRAQIDNPVCVPNHIQIV